MKASHRQATASRATKADNKRSYAQTNDQSNDQSNDQLSQLYEIIMDTGVPAQKRLNAYHSYELQVIKTWEHAGLTTTEIEIDNLGIESQSEFISNVSQLSTDTLQQCMLQRAIAANSSYKYHLQQAHIYTIWRELYSRGKADIISLHKWLEAVLSLEDER